MSHSVIVKCGCSIIRNIECSSHARAQRLKRELEHAIESARRMSSTELLHGFVVEIVPLEKPADPFMIVAELRTVAA